MDSPASFLSTTTSSASVSTMASSLSPSQPFRFLDLPKDVRLMVYERIPREIKHYAVVASKTTSAPCSHNASMIMVKKVVSTSILATCRQIHSEAISFVQKTIRDFILTCTPKIIMNVEACHDACAHHHLLGFQIFLDAVESLSNAAAGSQQQNWLEITHHKLENELCITESQTREHFINICYQTVHQLAFHGNVHNVQTVNVLPKLSSAGYQALFQENRLTPLYHMNLHLPYRAGFEVSMAGWVELNPESGSWCEKVPTYVQSRYSASAKHHYNIVGKSRVYGAMTKDTWVEEWLE